MTRIDIIEATIRKYCGPSVPLPAAGPRVKELAANIDAALVFYSPPPPPDSEAVVTLRLVKALLDEALRPRLIGPAD